MSPQVSAVICTRNRVASLRETLESVKAAAAAAPGVAIEIVVVDNGSSDGTADMVRAWASEAPFDVRIAPEPRVGLAIARNTGVEAARGDIIVFTDDDCRPHTDYFTALLSNYAEISGPAIVGGRVELGDERDLPMTIKTEKEPATFDGLDPGAFLIGSNLTMNRAAWRKVGLMDERLGAGTPLKASEETDYIHRAWLAGVPILYRPDMCVFHFHGRRSIDDMKKLWAGYSIGNGALFAKYWGTPYTRLLRWNVKNAVKEMFGGPKVNAELGLTYRAMVRGNVAGMLRYWMQTPKAPPPAANPEPSPTASEA
ncbi:MAG TPA: glycosyltransferase family A protein [Caulobacterales bacterium]|nr:glycosyltransferase family A protein [Caulobacterales bacterium]